MAQTVNLDAMIPRADFFETETGRSSTVNKIQEIPLSQLGSDSFLVPSLRKPDFQRETTHWTPDQIEIFIKSFLDNELVPSLILWKSPSDIFVIDGAHRVSALLAWINDDYGDGVLSKSFYNDKVSTAQKRVATRVRNKIQNSIGSYTSLRKVMLDPSVAGEDKVLISRANNAKTRALSLQWVEGDAQKAETSFFKINKQGTPLHKIEERLLRERKSPIAIAARSVVRAGTGHKYWSSFGEETRSLVEKKSLEMHELLFSPELEFPIKTLNLPHGGQASPIAAYDLMMDFLAFSTHESKAVNKDLPLYRVDEDGSGTLDVLEKCILVMRRITGNQSKSLGLHPAVFFYNDRGKHVDTIFIAMAAVIAKALRNNDSNFFKSFSENRKNIEKVFLENKSLLFQVNSMWGSGQRIPNWIKFCEKLSKGSILQEEQTAPNILKALNMENKVIAEADNLSGRNFSTDTKSAIFLQDSMDRASKCPLCGGYVHIEKAAQYDHILGKAEGGMGEINNGQITHPYCNSVKN